ncbi:MAG: GntR family transcriptional regulator [Deinococcota bacterium]
MPIPLDANLNRSFIRDDVYSSLKMWIIEGLLEPEEKLRDKDLAAQLGVSRTPVREALRRLEDEGLVETAANRWTRVAALKWQDAEQLYPIILSLESLALKLALPTLPSTQVEAMRAHNDALAKALTTADARAAVNADTAFHHVLIEAAANTELTDILAKLKTKCQRIELAYFSEPQLLTASLEEHERLLNALAEGNLQVAEDALTDNWQAAVIRLRQQHLEQHTNNGGES